MVPPKLREPFECQLRADLANWAQDLSKRAQKPSMMLPIVIGTKRADIAEGSTKKVPKSMTKSTRKYEKVPESMKKYQKSIRKYHKVSESTKTT